MKRLTLILIAAVVSITLNAKEVTEQQALVKAQEFMQGKQLKKTDLRRAASPENKAYYVFNAESNGGFVIVAGDDRMPEILGYSTKGQFHTDNNPPALNWWLTQMQNEVVSARQGGKVQQIPHHPAIQPLIKTYWGQDEPYNLRMPNRGDGASQYYFTGCVATAMAQVMYYYRCPEGVMATDIPDYLNQSLPATSFNWDIMQPSYWDSTGDGIDEVCKLMFYCCASVEGQLSFWETGAYPIDMTEALRRYFGFSETTHSVHRSSFSAEEWDQLIHHELEERRVVIYSGESVSTNGIKSHMFICDGCDSNGLYHINWGWNGDCDGYFLLSALNPEEEGIGGNQGSGGYSINQQATIGIQKASTAIPITTRAELGTIAIDEANDKIWKRSSEENDFPSVTISPVLYNNVIPKINRKYDTAIGLYHNTERISILEGDNESNRKEIEIECGMGKAMTISNIKFGKGLKDGDYVLKVLCRENGNEEWQEAINSDDNYIKAYISDNQMTLNINNGYYTENGEITVNSALIEGDLKMGEPLKFKVNVTNKGPHNNAAIYLWCNSDASDLSQYHLVAGLGTGLDAGSSGDYYLNYTPWRSGNHKFIISNSPYSLENAELYDLETDIKQSDRVVAMRLIYAEKTACEFEDFWGYKPIIHLYPQYLKTGTFTCNFGIAIRKNNQLVRREQFYEGWTFVDWKVCTLTFGGGMFYKLEDGEYQLSIDYQIGDGEWIPCIGSDTTFVEMKIDKGMAYFKNRFLNGDGFKIEAMSIEGKPLVNRKLNINVTATNNTPYPNHCIFLQVNDSVVGIRMFDNMETGATETKPFTRDWWDSTYDFYTSTDGSYIFNVIDGDGQAVISQSVNITKPLPAKLIATDCRFTNTTGEYVYAPGIKLLATLYNDSEYTYQDDLRLQIQAAYSVIGNDTTFMNYSPFAVIPIVLKPHEQKTFELEPAYNFYEKNLWTRANVYYYSEGDVKLLFRTQFYHFSYEDKYKIEPTLEITPVSETEEFIFSKQTEGTPDLSHTVIDNTYFNLNVTNGDGYDATEQALVLNSTTTEEQMNTIQDAKVGGAEVRNNFNGIIFELGEGKGTVTVDTKTIGTHVLNVQIGKGEPTKITKTERGTVDVPYNVTEPTYVYMYASTEESSAARMNRATGVADNSVLLYGYKVDVQKVIAGDANGDMKVNVSDIVEIVNDILGKPSAKYNRTAADVNGDGQVNVTDIVNVVNIIMTSGSK